MRNARRTSAAPHRPVAVIPARCHRSRAWSLIAGLLLVGAGCGGDDGPPSTTVPSTGVASTTSASSTTTGAGSTTTTKPAVSTTTVNNEAAVRAVVTTFFDGGATTDARVAALDNGESYRTMLADAAADPQGARLRAEVRTVTFPPDTACAGVSAAPPCAIVTFDLLVGGFPALVAHQGAATGRSGSWKVTAATWCAVVAIGGETCPSGP